MNGRAPSRTWIGTETPTGRGISIAPPPRDLGALPRRIASSWTRGSVTGNRETLIPVRPLRIESNGGSKRTIADLSWEAPLREPKSEGAGPLRAQVRGSWPVDEYVERTGAPRRCPVEHSSDNGSSVYTMLPVGFSSDSIYGTESAATQKSADRCQIFRQCLPRTGLFIYQTATKIGRANRRWPSHVGILLCLLRRLPRPLTKLNRICLSRAATDGRRASPAPSLIAELEGSNYGPRLRPPT